MSEARHDYDTPHTLARARRLVDLYPPAPGARVIDFATGTGIVALAAAERVGPEGSVLGIDIAPGLLAIARAKTAAAGTDAVRFLEQSIEAFEAPPGSFDLPYCSFAIVLLAG